MACLGGSRPPPFYYEIWCTHFGPPEASRNDQPPTALRAPTTAEVPAAGAPWRRPGGPNWMGPEKI
eukprot:8580701-Pyramimonas_sp.AAC.1